MFLLGGRLRGGMVEEKRRERDRLVPCYREEERETERDRRLSVEKARTYSTTRRHNSLHMRSTLTKHMIACFQLFTVYPLPAVRQQGVAEVCKPRWRADAAARQRVVEPSLHARRRGPLLAGQLKGELGRQWWRCTAADQAPDWAGCERCSRPPQP